MKRVTVDMAAQATGLFDVHRFRQHTKKERESAWHAFRALGVGGSDMSTILGLNPYSTPYDLWLEKTNRQQPEDISGKWAIVKGNALEVELRRRFRQLHPEYQVIDGTDISLVSKQHPLMHASLDGFVYDEASDSWGILEIKTANANRGRTDWHDETGELVAPQYYMAQVTHYMAVTGFTWGVFYADIGESEPVEVRFERDEDDIHAVIKAAEDFWGFVTRDEMPALTGADVAKAYPEPSPDIVDESADDDLYALLARYESAIRMLNDLKATQKELQEQIILRIGSHTGVRCGNLQATYKPTTRKEYVVKAATYRKFAFKSIEEKEK